MPMFMTIGYGDQAGYDRTATEVRAAAHRHDERLRRLGAVMAMAEPPVQVRNPDGGGVEVVAGRYAASALPVAGFALIEAADLDEAVRLASGTPCAVAGGVVEVWPMKQA